MMKRHRYDWLCRERTLSLGHKTHIMGVLNVTPDSFSDGGRYTDTESAVVRALEMVQQGASIIDVGGESTRPGATPVLVSEEIARVEEVVRHIRKESNVFISIDTMHAETAQCALEAGADIINDVSALRADPNMAQIAQRYGAGVILMHMQGTPQTMQQAPMYDDPPREIATDLSERMNAASDMGIKQACLAIDPGIGFGKTTAHNLELIQKIESLSECRAPLVVGVSRKRFIGELLDRPEPTARLAGGLGLAAWSVLHGVHILRTHDVIDTCDVCTLIDRLMNGDVVCS